MPEEKTVTVIENPEPDARSAEEQAIANTVGLLLANKMIGVVVGAGAPGIPKRFVGVSVGLWPWQIPRFNRAQRVITTTVREIVKQEDAVIEVQRMPTKIAASLVMLRILQRPRPRPKDNDAVRAETAKQ
jgi:hypothetical protein